MKFMTDMTVKNLPAYMQMAEKQKQNNIAQQQAQAKQDQLTKMDTLGRKFLAMGDYSAEGIQKFAQDNNASTPVMKELVGMVSSFQKQKQERERFAYDKNQDIVKAGIAKEQQGYDRGQDTIKTEANVAKTKREESKVTYAKVNYVDKDGKMKTRFVPNDTTEIFDTPPKQGQSETIYDSAGNVIVQRGMTPGGKDPAALTTANRTGVQKKLMDLNASYADFVKINDQYDPEFLTVVGKLGTSWSNVKEMFGGDLSKDEKTKLEKITQFRQSSFKALNKYIHDITGAVMSAAEADRIMETMPNPGTGPLNGDGPTKFIEKLKSAQYGVEMGIARNNYVNSFGLSPVETLQKRTELEKTGTMDSVIEERGYAIEDELKKKNPTISEEELVKQSNTILSKEFGIQFGAPLGGN